ncbi:MAG: 16S rRNA (guanine(966)-N(2))-methyltransferase RsmD [Oscillospiraceae bacterium]
MRVITGTAKGRKLLAPEGLDTRPTSDMAKEAIFSILQFELEGALVLDLFAGSGQLGIEALSRGARGAIFIDSSREAQATILSNLDKTGLRAAARVSQMDAAMFLRGTQEQFDIALLDPPYGTGLISQALPLLVDHMNPGGLILCETERNEILPDSAGIFTEKREYRYGKAKVTTYRRVEEAR